MRLICSLVCFLVIATAVAEEMPQTPGDLPSAEWLRFMRTADAVYVFPFISAGIPRRDHKHLRLLGSDARRMLLRLLCDRQNWYHGLITVLEPSKQSFGLVFRSGRDELVLFFNDLTIEGSFRGRRTLGMLEDKPRKEMKEWAQRYAEPELHPK